MRGVHSRSLALALVPLLAALAACGSSAESAEQQADEVDASQLVVYSGRNEELVGDLLERFEQRSGIPVSVRYGNTAQLAAQLLEEGDRTAADVYFSQDAGALGALAKSDRLVTLPQSTLDKVDSGFRADDGRWVGTSGRARVLVYDPNQVTEAQLPQTVAELTSPEWKGKVGIAPSNASFETFVTAMRVIDGEDAARSWLEGMVANDVQTFDNNVQILNAAEDGKIAVGLINHYYWYEQVAEEGLAAVPARLHWFNNGNVGGLVNVAGVGILAGSDRPAEAQQLVDFLLSEEGQRYFADETKEYPLIASVPTAADLPPLTSLVRPNLDLSDLDTLDQTLAMLEEAGLT